MTEKLQKVLARLGVGSRRELDALIAQGRVEVNGKVATVGERVEDDITVKIDGRVVATPLSSNPKCRVLMYYKPEGELTTISDPEGRPTVFDHIPKPDTGRWIYVGRLDLNTSGLLLFTTDGELANALMHPKNAIERVYAARIYGDVSDEQISALLTGVKLKDGMAKFDKVSFQGGDGRNAWYHVSLKEGRNREVRRLWEGVGLKVSRLIRIKYAGLALDETLKTGQYRELTLSEINNIRALSGLKSLSDSQIARTPLALKSQHKKGPKMGSAAARPKGRAARDLRSDDRALRRSDAKDALRSRGRDDKKRTYGRSDDRRSVRFAKDADSYERSFSLRRSSAGKGKQDGYRMDRGSSRHDERRSGSYGSKDGGLNFKVVRSQRSDSSSYKHKDSQSRHYSEKNESRTMRRDSSHGGKKIIARRGRDWS